MDELCGKDNCDKVLGLRRTRKNVAKLCNAKSQTPRSLQNHTFSKQLLVLLVRAIKFHHFKIAQLLPALPKAPLPPRFHRRIPRHRVHALDSTRIRLLTPPFPPRLNIPPARTAATQPHLDQPRKDHKRGRNPHEDKHLCAKLGTDVNFRDGRNCVAEDDEHDSGENGGDGDDECIEEGEDRDGKSEPAREDGKWHEKYQDEGEAGAG
jgi:hypothetical protein